MARVHFVKKARKNNPAVQAGEPYFWWAFRFGGKHYSKTAPRPSQLTQSHFRSGWRAISEAIEDAEQAGEIKTSEELKTLLEGLAEDLRELSQEAEESLENMPEGLREGDTGLQLQERADAASTYADALEAISEEAFSIDLDNIEEGEYDAGACQRLREFIDAGLAEAQNEDPGEPD